MTPRQQLILLSFILPLMLCSCFGSSEASGEITGKVLDAAGKPVADAQIGVKSYSLGQTMSSYPGGDFDAATTDAGGNFSIRPKNLHEWTVFAWKDGYYPAVEGKKRFAGKLVLTPGKSPDACSANQFVIWMSGQPPTEENSWEPMLTRYISPGSANVLHLMLDAFRKGETFARYEERLHGGEHYLY